MTRPGQNEITFTYAQWLNIKKKGWIELCFTSLVMLNIVKSNFLFHIAKVRNFYVLETLKSKLAHWFVWITERSTMISYTNYVFRYHSQCSLKLWFYLRWLHNLLFALIIFLQGFKICLKLKNAHSSNTQTLLGNT